MSIRIEVQYATPSDMLSSAFSKYWIATIKRLKPAIVFFVLSFTTCPGSARAQSAADSDGRSAAEACAGDEFRQFDFWIGEWIVRDSAGTEVGRNRITRQADGCALLEQWSGSGGTSGTSLNYFDPTEGVWRQHWVGGNGLLLDLAGEFENDRMVMSGSRHTSEGEVLDRISWQVLPDGRVRQEWDASSDGGESWTRVFLGLYERE